MSGRWEKSWACARPARAKGGEVFVSGTVKDIVPGSGLSFEDRSTHALKGVPGKWRLYRAAGF